MKNNDQIIRDFAAAWQRLDADELAGYFTEDAIYHNIPMEIITVWTINQGGRHGRDSRF